MQEQRSEKHRDEPSFFCKQETSNEGETSMESVDILLNKYREADLHGRLNLYLMYRDLRRDFIAIDRADICRNALRCNRKETQEVKELRLCHCS